MPTLSSLYGSAAYVLWSPVTTSGLETQGLF